MCSVPMCGLMSGSSSQLHVNVWGRHGRVSRLASSAAPASMPQDQAILVWYMAKMLDSSSNGSLWTGSAGLMQARRQGTPSKLSLNVYALRPCQPAHSCGVTLQGSSTSQWTSSRSSAKTPSMTFRQVLRCWCKPCALHSAQSAEAVTILRALDRQLQAASSMPPCGCWLGCSMVPRPAQLHRTAHRPPSAGQDHALAGHGGQRAARGAGGLGWADTDRRHPGPQKQVLGHLLRQPRPPQPQDRPGKQLPCTTGSAGDRLLSSI